MNWPRDSGELSYYQLDEESSDSKIVLMRGKKTNRQCLFHGILARFWFSFSLEQAYRSRIYVGLEKGDQRIQPCGKHSDIN